MLKLKLRFYKNNYENLKKRKICSLMESKQQIFSSSTVQTDEKHNKACLGESESNIFEFSQYYVFGTAVVAALCFIL